MDWSGMRRLHRGTHHEVWAGPWQGREACVKHARRDPPPETEPSAFVADWSVRFSRFISVIGRSGEVMRDPPVGPLLLLEADGVRESRGAWGHQVWGIEEDRERGPCLVMPRHPGTSLDRWTRAAARRVLPRALPFLWDALAGAVHGDVQAGNVLVREDDPRPVLVDPGVRLESSRRLSGTDSDHTLVYTTTPAAYPVLPPWYSSDLSLAEGCTLADHFESFLLQLSRSSRPARVGRHTTGFVVATAAPAVGEKAARSEPHPADLLAVGVLYHEALTGRHPFLDADYPQPAWIGGRAHDHHALGFDPARRRLEQGPAAPSLTARGIRSSEDRLALALLSLAVPSREALVDLAGAVEADGAA